MVVQITNLHEITEKFRLSKRIDNTVKFLPMNANNKDYNKKCIAMQGYLRKVKCLKKRYVILEESYGITLQIFDNHKKYENGASPKKVIHLYDVFNVVRLNDKKHLFVFRLLLTNERIDLVAETEEDLMLWLNAIEQARNNLKTKTTETVRRASLKVHQWIIDVKSKGIANTKQLFGQYILQVTSTHLNLLDADNNDVIILPIPLWLVRKSVYTENVIFVELSDDQLFRSNEIWLDAESNEVAEEIHRVLQASSKPRAQTFLQEDHDILMKISATKYPECKRSHSFSDTLQDIIEYYPFAGVSMTADSDTASSLSSTSTANVSRSSSMDIQEILESDSDNVFRSEPVVDRYGGATDSYYQNHVPKALDSKKLSNSASFADDESDFLNEYANQERLRLSGYNFDVNGNVKSPPPTYQRRKQSKDKRLSNPDSYENVFSILNESKKDRMDSVNLVRFKSDNGHIIEPCYESVCTSRGGLRNTRNLKTLRKMGEQFSPEGSPSLVSRKYIVNNSTYSPKQPRLPKRNPNNSFFYVKQDEYETMDGFEVKDKLNTNVYDEAVSEPKYIDIDTVEQIRRSLVLDGDNNDGYAEIKTKTKRTSRCRSVDQSDLSRELVTLKFPRQKSEYVHSEKDEECIGAKERSLKVLNTGKTPARSRSAPVKLNNFESVQIEFYGYVDPEINITMKNTQENDYINNSILNKDNCRFSAGYELMNPASTDETDSIFLSNNATDVPEVPYDNVDPALCSSILSYADINIHRHTLRAVEENREKLKILDEGVEYTTIDFEKSLGISDAVRERDSHFIDGKDISLQYTDMSYKTFKR